MRNIYWKNCRLIVFCVTIILCYLCLRLRSQHVTTSAILRDTKPKDVWEFVADFSNMKQLNPTITDFNIISESGNYDHWRYHVEYSEILSHWPYTKNVNNGHISVHVDGKNYVINSEHKTCFLNQWYCLESTGEFQFTSTAGGGTRCIEMVTFQCPALFSFFCKREAIYQRNSIMDNLRRQFNPKK